MLNLFFTSSLCLGLFWNGLLFAYTGDPKDSFAAHFLLATLLAQQLPTCPALTGLPLLLCGAALCHAVCRCTLKPQQPHLTAPAAAPQHATLCS